MTRTPNTLADLSAQIEAMIRDFMAQKIARAALCADDEPEALAAVLDLAKALGCPAEQPEETYEEE